MDAETGGCKSSKCVPGKDDLLFPNSGICILNSYSGHCPSGYSHLTHIEACEIMLYDCNLFLYGYYNSRGFVSNGHFSFSQCKAETSTGITVNRNLITPWGGAAGICEKPGSDGKCKTAYETESCTYDSSTGEYCYKFYQSSTVSILSTKTNCIATTLFQAPERDPSSLYGLSYTCIKKRN